MKSNRRLTLTLAGLTFAACSKAPLVFGATPPPARSGAAPVPQTAPVPMSAPPTVASSALAPVVAPAAASSGHFVTGPPWGDVWCLTTDAFWSKDLSAKYFPKGADVRFTKPEKCTAQVLARAGDRHVGATVDCGDAYGIKTPWPWYKVDLLDKAVRDPEFGVLLRTQSWALPRPVTDLDAVLSNVPCKVHASVAGWATTEETGRLARNLMKDLIARVTPASIARPRAELVVNRFDVPLATLKAELARWPTKMKAVSRYAPLSPGYPKLISSTDYPGLPPGKHFLLFAICRSTRGNQLSVALSASQINPRKTYDDLPLAFHSVDGLGLPEDCPAALDDDPTTMHTDVMQRLLPDGRYITTGLMDTPHVTTPDEVRARAGIFLFAHDGTVLDSVNMEFRVPVDRAGHGPYASQSHAAYSDCSTLLLHDQPPNVPIAFSCVVKWEDEICSRPRHETWIHSFDATADNKLQLSTSHQHNKGDLCKPNDNEEGRGTE